MYISLKAAAETRGGPRAWTLDLEIHTRILSDRLEQLSTNLHILLHQTVHLWNKVIKVKTMTPVFTPLWSVDSVHLSYPIRRTDASEDFFLNFSTSF